MNDEELRRLVRAAIARQLGGSIEAPSRWSAAPRSHPSHGLLHVLAGSDMEGPCVIEPAVGCNHCGYCKALGH